MRLGTRFGLLFSIAALAAPATADTVTFKDGAPTPFLGTQYEGTEDAMLPTNSGSFTDQNFGARGNMEVGLVLPGHVRRSLLRFDVTALDGEFSASTP